MEVGDRWIRKDIEITIIHKFLHSSKESMIYVVQSRIIGQEQVEYMLIDTEFSEPYYHYDGNDL